MSTTTKMKTRRTLETPHDAAKRILLGGTVDPTLSADRVTELVELRDEAARKGDADECERWRTALRDKRRASATWDVVDEDGDLMHEMPEGAIVALLQDVREELQGIRRALEKRRV